MEIERFEFVLAFLCWMLPFLLKAQDLSTCWFGAPYISDGSVTPEISVVKKPISATHFNWSIQATVSWQQPPGFQPETDSYVVSLRKVEDGHTPEDEICAITGNEITVDVEAVTFTNLSFGFLYEFKVYPYRVTESKKSFMSSMTAFQTPDCYQATGDADFCSMVDVRYSGAPLDPLLESICFNETSQSIEVEISWLPPIQVNGILSFFGLLVTSPSDVSVLEYNPFDPPPSLEPPASFPGEFGPIGGHQVIVDLPPSYQEGDKISTRLTSLRENELYFVTITPFVSTVDSMNIDGGSVQGGSRGAEFNAGIEVEMSFHTETRSSNSTTEILLCGEVAEMPTTKIFDEPPLYNQLTRTASTPGTPTKAPDGKNEMDGKGLTTAKMNLRGSGKTKGTTKGMNRGGSGIMGLPAHERPITPTGIVIVVLGTLVVTILILTTLIVGVHYMRGTAPESPTKLGSMNGSGRTNGKSPEENGTPFKEQV